MKKIVHIDMITDDTSIPDYPNAPGEEVLRGCLFSAVWFDELDLRDYCTIMDYEGFVEFFNAHIPQWKAEDNDDDFWNDYTALQYIQDNLGRTICAVKETKI